ncbi:hypothetical protein fHeYen902_223 [Yersinia phage fHe-Yen9-02]|nr:hypothetical protein fHeYen902_223 [Yersinia phage fHe-Yen9-02]
MSKVSSKSIVPTRLDRISKKSASIATGKAKASELPHDISISATQAHEVQGFILSITDNSVTLRHKRGFGSSKQIVSTFTSNQIIERVGDEGGVGQLLVVANMPVRELKGQKVSVKGNTITATDILSGEVTTINQNVPGFSVSMSVDESAAAKKYGIADSSAKSAKKSDKGDKSAKSGKKAKK